METSCKLTQFSNRAIFYRPRKQKLANTDCLCKWIRTPKGTNSGSILEFATLARDANILFRLWTLPNLASLAGRATRKMNSSKESCTNQVWAAIKSGSQSVKATSNSSRQEFKEERKMWWPLALIQTKTKRLKSFLAMKLVKVPVMKVKTSVERSLWEWTLERTMHWRKSECSITIHLSSNSNSNMTMTQSTSHFHSRTPIVKSWRTYSLWNNRYSQLTKV